MLQDPDTLQWSIYTQQVINYHHITPTLIIILLVYVLTITVSISSAFVSMRVLRQHHLERQKAGLPSGAECPACFTVCLINFLVMSQFLISAVSLVLIWTKSVDMVVVHYLEFLQFPFTNCVLSALNPLIMLVRSGRFGSVKEMFKSTKREHTAATFVSVSDKNTVNNTSKAWL